MKILFHAIDGMGLGHINREVCIANAIKKIDKKAEIVFVTNNPFTFFLESNSIRYRRLPGIWKGSRNDFRSMNNKTKENIEAIKNTIIEENPDATVYDTDFPEELLNDKCSRGIKNILIFRKCKEDVMAKLFLSNAIKIFDRIIIPHTEEEFGFEIPSTLRKKTFFVGPIIREASKNEEEIISKYGLNGKFVILASCGGGGHPKSSEFFIKTVLDALNSIDIQRLKGIIVTGPFFRRRLKGNINTKIVDFVPDIISLMSLSDIFICEAGYNTINEITRARAPSIIIPGERYLDDQVERAISLEKRRAVIVLREYDSKKLRNMLISLYKNRGMLKRMKQSFPVIKEGNRLAALKILEAVRE